MDVCVAGPRPEEREEILTPHTRDLFPEAATADVFVESLTVPAYDLVAAS